VLLLDCSTKKDPNELELVQVSRVKCSYHPTQMKAYNVTGPESSQVNQVFEEFQMTAHLKRTDVLAGYLGLLNRIVWTFCQEYDLTTQEGSGRLLDKAKIERLRGKITAGQARIRVSLEATERYLRKFWAGSTNTRKTIRKYRTHCADMGLFRVGFSQFIPQRCDGIPRTPPAEITHINLGLIFKLIAIIEKALEFKGFQWQHFTTEANIIRDRGKQAYKNDVTWNALGGAVQGLRRLGDKLFPKHGNALPHLLRKALGSDYG
jgi:hypothetical protein